MTMHVTLTSLDQLRFTTAQLRERLHDEAKLRGGFDGVWMSRRAQHANARGDGSGGGSHAALALLAVERVGGDESACTAHTSGAVDEERRLGIGVSGGTVSQKVDSLDEAGDGRRRGHPVIRPRAELDLRALSGLVAARKQQLALDREPAAERVGLV